MKKWLRITLAVAVGLLWLSVRSLPLFSDWEWLPGWPKFVADQMTGAAYMLWIFLVSGLNAKNRQQWKTKKGKWVAGITAFILVVALTAANIWTNFRSDKTRTIEHLHSPNHVNMAIVRSFDGSSGGLVYPVRARFFYDRKEYASWPPRDADWDWTYTWLDDNTLEIKVNFKIGGAYEQYLHW